MTNKVLQIRNRSPLERLEFAIEVLHTRDPSIRPLTPNKKPGGLFQFSEDDKREVILIGDLHANKKNLKAILQDEKNLRKLHNNELVILFLGDAFHDERVGHLSEMESSVEMLYLLLRLFNQFPDNIIYIQGNHDSFDPRLVKNRLQQGLLFQQAVIEAQGEIFAEKVEEFFDALPVFVIHPHFLAVHAGPIRNGATKDELINIRNYVDFHWQLTWNRINETNSTPSKKEYSPDDLEILRYLLKQPPEIPIIVGHNPMWKWGGNASVWINPLTSKNHVILYGSKEDKAVYISFTDSMEYKVKEANLKLKKRRFVMDNY